MFWHQARPVPDAPRVRMVESLKELNKICQKPRYREVGNWYVRRILRDGALPITWLLLHTPVTANQVTAFSLVVGLFGVSLFAASPTVLFFAGCLLLQFWYLLDHVDGQIARYRKTASLSGRFFDFLTHHLIHGTVFFSLGVYAFRITDSLFIMVWGFVASLATLVFNLIHDTKSKTFVEALVRSEKIFRVNQPSEETQNSEKKEGPKTAFSKAFSFLHKIFEIHVLMNLLTVAALLELWRLPVDMRLFFFFVYGCAVPLISAVKITYLIQGQKIDREFQGLFQEVLAK